MSTGAQSVGRSGAVMAAGTLTSRIAGMLRATLLASVIGTTGLAAEAFTELWSLPDRPTAVVTAGSRLSAGVLQAMGRMKLQVPRDVSVIGFGDAPWWYTELSIISLPVRELALSCGEFLLRQIRAGRRDGEPVYQAVHRPTLVLRGSTAPTA